LLEGGGDWTVADVNGNTPFSIAQKERNFDILKLFGKFEADRARRGDPPFGVPAAGKAADSSVSGDEADAGAGEEEDGDADLPQVVRCVFADRKLHLRMPLVPTPARLKRTSV
jgi:hypothetical protein